jgi:hypothetical protein
MTKLIGLALELPPLRLGFVSAFFRFDFFLILLPQRVSTDDGFCRGLGYRSHLFWRDWRNPHARLFGGFAPDFSHYISGKEFKK